MPIPPTHIPQSATHATWERLLDQNEAMWAAMYFDGDRAVVGISELAERDSRDFTAGRLLLIEPDGAISRVAELAGEGLVLAVEFVEGWCSASSARSRT